jgi:hypothetical protein
MINLYVIKNDFIPFITEFLRKKVVVIVPVYTDNINTIEYFIQDNIFRITISSVHYYYFVSEMDINRLMKTIRVDILDIKKKEKYGIIEDVLEQFVNDETLEIRMNSIKKSIELIDYYEINIPFTLCTIDNNKLNTILDYYTSIK